MDRLAAADAEQGTFPEGRHVSVAGQSSKDTADSNTVMQWTVRMPASGLLSTLPGAYIAVLNNLCDSHPEV
jgi:hypothetical protein